MVNRLAELYGTRLMAVQPEEFLSLDRDSPSLLHDFPTVHQFELLKMEEILRLEGFGYRAAYIKYYSYHSGIEKALFEEVLETFFC